MFKSRGKTKDGKRVVGWNVKVGEAEFIITDNAMIWQEQDDDYNGPCLHTYTWQISNFVEVIPETVSYSTGLFDKNRDEIFGGMWLQIQGVCPMEVGFVNGAFSIINIMPVKSLYDRVHQYSQYGFQGVEIIKEQA